MLSNTDSLTHFSRDLATLAVSPYVTLHIHATHSSSSILIQNVGNEKAILNEGSVISPNSAVGSQKQSIIPYDVEKSPQSDSSSSSVSDSASLPANITIHAGRPDVSVLITGVVNECQSGDRVIVAACGPQGLVDAAKGTVGDILVSGSKTIPSVDFHAETFGW